MAYKKKLIEVALPLIEINEVAAREKNTSKGGHPFALHLWWARRPLSVARAVIFSSIVDDPSNYMNEQDAKKERKRLFKLITELVNIKGNDSHSNKIFDKAYQEILKSTKNNPPSVIDPFCGGGTIPFEAHRLKLDTFGSDLNPIAVLINKGLMEIPFRFLDKPPVNPISQKSRINESWSKSKGLAEDLRYYGQWILDEAYKRIGKYYPRTKDNKTVIGWFWYRTVKCENPACRKDSPLVTSFVLSRKKGTTWLQPEIHDNQIKFNVRTGKGIQIKSTKVARGAKFNCLFCNQLISEDYIKKKSNEGKIDYKLMAMVTQGNRKKIYLSPTEEQEVIAKSAKPQWLPTEKMNRDTKDLVSGRGYGFFNWSDLFTSRQQLALTTFTDLINEVKNKVIHDCPDNLFSKEDKPLDKGGSGKQAYAEAISTYLAFCVDRCADYWNSLISWHAGNEQIAHLFGKQAIAMNWDFIEANPFGETSGSWKSLWLYTVSAVENLGYGKPAIIRQLDAKASIDSMVKSPVVSTDPPYYDNISYAELSDFFYVWLKRMVGKIYPDLFATTLTPKSSELIVAPHRYDNDRNKAKNFFLEGMQDTFTLFAEKSNPEYPITIYYAYRQTQSEGQKGDLKISSTGWEIMLSSLINAGLKIVGTWPLRTERVTRPVGLSTNSLASSIVIVCRIREKDAIISTRREFITMLKKEIPPAIKNLQEAGIAPVDLAQSAIGPGMAVFSRYSKVLEADGNPMTVRTALQIINQELDSYFTEQESDMDKETRFCIAWYEQFGWKDAPFGIAEGLMKAQNTAINSLEAAGVISAKAGKVRLLKRDELKQDWDPTTDKKLTIWECVQYLIKALEDKGESGAAEILKKIGGLSEPVKELAYRLYALCEKKGWTEDSLVYNNLIASWQSVTDKAQFAIEISESTKKKLKDKEQKTLNDI